MPRFHHDLLDEDQMQEVVENAADFDATGVFDSDGMLVAIANASVAPVIAAALNIADDVPVGQAAWLWA